MNLINITSDHFVTADGKAALSTDKNGYPIISPEMVTRDELRLGAIALALYSNGLALHESKQNVDVVIKWARQYKYYD
jgi:hypothetical protein